MNEDKKIILIKGGKSRWFEQAIFILKDKDAKCDLPKNFVEEAEKIINNYMLKKNLQAKSSKLPYPKNNTKTKKVTVKNKNNAKAKKYDNIINISLILSCIMIGLILYYFN